MRILLVVFGLVAALSAGYFYWGYNQPLTVADLYLKSDDLNGKKVAVFGTVQNRIGVFGTGVYVLSDGQVDVVVVSETGVPSKGSEIEVKGIFHQAFLINDIEYAVIYQGGGRGWGG